MFGFVYSSALRDFFRPTRAIVWVFVAAVVFGIGMVWTRISGTTEAGIQFGQLSGILVYRVLALAAAIFATMVVSQDVEQKTIVYTLTRVVPRQTMLLARSLAAITCVAIVSCLACTAGMLSVLGPNGFASSAYWADMGIMVLGAFAYSALFIFVSLLMNRAMIVCLLFAFGWESFVPRMPGDLYYLSIGTYLKGLATHPRPEQETGIQAALAGQTVETLVPPVPSLIVLVAIIGIFTVMGGLWFQRFEYSPREDAE